MSITKKNKHKEDVILQQQAKSRNPVMQGTVLTYSFHISYSIARLLPGHL